MAAHGIPYFATATVAYPDDLFAKVERARRTKGLRFLHVLAPCPPGWRIDSEDVIRYGRLAVASHAFPLFEVVEGCSGASPSVRAMSRSRTTFAASRGSVR